MGKRRARPAPREVAGLEAQICRRPGCKLELFHCPLLPGLAVSPDRFRREPVEHRVISRMHRHQLALQMGGQFSQLQTVGGQGTEYFITISLALGGAFQIEQAAVPRRNLHTLVAQTSGPVRDTLEAVERSSISSKLRQRILPDP